MLKGKNKTYRNINDFSIDKENCIDAGSLWNLVGNKLVLVDDDQFVQTDINPDLFKKAD